MVVFIPAKMVVFTPALTFGAMKLGIEEKFSGGIQTSGLKEDGAGIAPNSTLSLITRETKARIAEIEKRIISGEIILPQE